MSDFQRDVLRNPANGRVLAALREAALPDAWLVAGCLFQTVWNLRQGRAPAQDIADYDVFYFDADDLSREAEQAAQRRVEARLARDGGPALPIEVKNQARVHLWYEDWFGHPYSALRSSCEGIERFLVACTCVGLSPDGRLHAPHGLEELYAGVLRPNPAMRQPALFAAKAASYQRRWPWLVEAVEATS